MKALSHNLVIVMKGQASQARQERQLLARSELRNNGLIEINKILLEKDLSLGTSIIQINVESFTRVGKALYFKSIRSSNQIPEEVLLKILRHVLCSLNCLHQNDLVHGNFQLKDIVKAKGTGLLKVADQFMETQEENIIPIQSLLKPLNQLVLNDCHFAPEILSKIAANPFFQAYTPENDLWAVGIVLLQLALLKNLAPVIYDYQTMSINRNLLLFHVTELKETGKYPILHQILTQYLLNEDPEMRKLIHLKLESMDIFKDQQLSLGESVQRDTKIRFQSIQEQLNNLPSFFTQTKQFKHLEYFNRTQCSMHSKLNKSTEFIKIQDQQQDIGRICKSEGNQKEQKESLRLSNSQFIKKMIQNVEPIYEEVEEDSAEKKTNPKLQFFAELELGNSQKQQEVNTFETEQPSRQLILELAGEQKLIQQTSDKKNSHPSTESQIPSISNEERFAQNLLGIEITSHLTERQPTIHLNSQNLLPENHQNENIQQNELVQSCSNEKLKTKEILETDEPVITQQNEIMPSQYHLSGNKKESRDPCDQERNPLNSGLQQNDSAINSQLKQDCLENLLTRNQCFGQSQQFGQTEPLQVPPQSQTQIQAQRGIPETQFLEGETNPQHEISLHQENRLQKEIIILEPQEEKQNQNKSQTQLQKLLEKNQANLRSSQTKSQTQENCERTNFNQKPDSRFNTILSMFPQSTSQNQVEPAVEAQQLDQEQFVLNSQTYQATLENRFSELTMRLDKAIQESRRTRKSSKQRNKSDYCLEKANDLSLNNTTLDNSELSQLKSFWSPELTQRK